MFEAIDVVISGVGATAISLFIYSAIKKPRYTTSSKLTDKQKRKRERFNQIELWEHKANATALGITVFMLLVFYAATNLSHYPYWPRQIITGVCVFSLLFILRSLTRAVFRYCRNRPAKST